jgi:hypothetical protein
VFSFLGLDRGPGRVSPDAGQPCARPPDELPAGRIGAPLLGRINRLHAELGYPPM